MNLRKKKADTGAGVLTALRKSDVGAFRSAVNDLYKVGGHIDIFKRDAAGGTPEHRGKLPIENAVTDDDLLSSIRKDYGDGIYSFKFFDGKGDRVGQEHFLALGDVKKEAKKKKGDDSSDGLKGTAALYAKMMEIQSNEKVALIEQQTKMMEMLNSRDNNGMSQAELLTIITTTLSGSYDRGIELAKALQPQGDGGTELVAALLEGFRLRAEIQPQVEREEPLAAMIHAILPFLGQIMSAKRGSGQLDPNTLAQLQAVLQQYQRSTGVSPSLGAPAARSGINHPPPPGGSDHRSATTAADGLPAPSGMSGLWGRPNANVTEPAESPIRSASPAAGSPDYFYQRYVHPFRQDIASGQSDDALAYQIIAMVEYSRDQMEDDPSPLMVDFLNAGSLGDYEKAYYKFCAAIPELAQAKAKQESIKASLVRYLVPVGSQVNAPEDRVPSGDMDGMGITEFDADAEEDDVENADTSAIGRSEAGERAEHEDQPVIEGVVTQVQHENV